MRPPVRFAHSGDVAIAYTHVGEGPIDLLYLSTLNNLDLTWENPLYAGFLQRIAEHARLIALDRRGQGISDRLSPKDIPLLEDTVDDVIAVLDAVGSERRCSWAARISAPCAPCWPPRTRSVSRA
jgi:pimeloyl-ACP methyl ester carboxylesterase